MGRVLLRLVDALHHLRVGSLSGASQGVGARMLRPVPHEWQAAAQALEKKVAPHMASAGVHCALSTAWMSGRSPAPARSPTIFSWS